MCSYILFCSLATKLNDNKKKPNVCDAITQTFKKSFSLQIYFRFIANDSFEEEIAYLLKML